MRRGSIGQQLPKPSQQFSDAQLLVQALLRQGEEAKSDLTKFFDVVIKHEYTKKPISAAPHQRVLFSLIQHHPRLVIRQPIGTSKTYTLGAFGLFQLGRDDMARGLLLSQAQGMAEKPLGMVSNYITEPALNIGLARVFPKLRRGMNPSDPWTRNRITIARAAGTRDPSLIAVGLDTKYQGARISFLMADDIINDENSRTKESRDQVRSEFFARGISRLDRYADRDSRAIVANTPWHREDLTYYLEREMGWTTVTMDIYGNIWFSNITAEWLAKSLRDGLIRASSITPGAYRLAAHDPDPDETIPLWPEEIGHANIDQAKKDLPPHQFAQMYLCAPFDESTMRCQKDWIEKCKLQGMGLTLVREYDGPNPTFIGIDLGIGQGLKNDVSCFFVFELLPDRKRRILWIESGRYLGPTIVEKIIDLHDRYGASVAVETVQAQEFIRHFALQARKDLNLQPHVTNRVNKHAQEFGVESIFIELQNGVWVIPCDANGNCHPEVQKWIDDNLFYQPGKHTGNHLMACWIARERARKQGSAGPQFVSKSHNEWFSQSRTSAF